MFDFKPKSGEPKRFNLADMLAGNISDLVRVNNDEDMYYGVWVLPAEPLVLAVTKSVTIERYSPQIVSVRGALGAIAEICTSDPEGFCVGVFNNVDPDVQLDIGGYRAGEYSGAAAHLHLAGIVDEYGRAVHISVFEPSEKPFELAIEVHLWNFGRRN